MSARKIAITIQVINQQAIQATVAQTAATNNLNAAVQGQTHLQAGLTNSFIKGNLAARAISVGYLAVRDAIRDMTKTGIEFQFTMAKIHAISGESGESVRVLGTSIRDMAKASMKSAPEIAAVANEMGKMGLTTKQVDSLIGSITTLGVALDEDLVVAGETVVKVLNTYGLSVSNGKKISEQLAFTVAASALDLEKFGTAFSYVGGTAAVARVKFEDLAGSMDFLSNAGIKSSTIGTQLRRIIADLANENSKAGIAIGGTATSVGGLVPALKKLDEVLPKDSDKRIAVLTDMFGRTATSVAALMIKNADAIADFSKRTTEASGNLDRMKGIMDDTFAAALGKHQNAWRELGMVIGEVVGPAAKAALNYLTDYMNLLSSGKVTLYGNLPVNQIFKPKVMGMGDLKTLDETNLKAELDAYTKAQGAMANGVDEAALSVEELDKQVKALKETFEGIQGNLDIDQILGKEVDYDFYIKKYEALAESFKKLGASKEVASVLREIKKAEEELFEVRSLGSGDDLKGSKRMLDFQSAVAPDSFEDTNFKNQDKGERFEKLKKAGELFDKSTAEAIQTSTDRLGEFNYALLRSEIAFGAVGVATESVNGSMAIFSTFIAEGLLSKKENPFKGISDAFGDFAKQMVADLVRMIMKLLVFRTILFAVTGGKSGFFGGFGFASQGGSGFADSFLGGLGGQKFASGTDQIVDRPTMFMVGEAGRERVQVTPRAKVGQSGGSKIVVNIQGDVYGGEKFNEAVALAEKKLSRSRI